MFFKFLQKYKCPFNFVEELTEFKFTGKITSQVSYIYNGQPCVKEGTYTFKKHQGRAFYRLQEKTNCDGSAVDYVDIY